MFADAWPNAEAPHFGSRVVAAEALLKLGDASKWRILEQAMDIAAISLQSYSDEFPVFQGYPEKLQDGSLIVRHKEPQLAAVAFGVGHELDPP